MGINKDQTIAVETRFALCSSHFRVHPEHRPVRDDPARIDGWHFRSCRASHIFQTEFRAVYPHPMQQDSKFAGCADKENDPRHRLSGKRDNGATATLGADQSHAPQLTASLL